MADYGARFRAEKQLMKHPNLYGAYGAVKETVGTIGRAAAAIPQRFVSDPLLHGDLSAYAPSTYVDAAVDASGLSGVPTERTPNAYGFPSSAIREMGRVRGLRNQQGGGVVSQVADQGIRTTAEQIASAQERVPSTSSQPSTQGLRGPGPTQVNFEDFAEQYQGLTADQTPAIDGPRIIRRPGETPILTNLTGARLDAALQQPDLVRNNVTGQELTASQGFRNVNASQAQQLGLTAPTAPTRNRFYNPEDFGSDFGSLIAANAAKAKQDTFDNLVAQGYDPAEAAAQAELESTARQGIGGLTEARGIAGLRSRLSARKAAEAELGLKRSQLEVNQANAEAATLTARANAVKAIQSLKEGDDNITFDIAPPGVLDQFGSQKQSTLKIGKDEFPIDNAAAVTLDSQAKTYAQQYFDQFPDASDSYESIYKKALVTLLKQQGGNLGIRTQQLPAE